MTAISQAVANQDMKSIEAIFGDDGSWLHIGQGEQRSLAAHFITTAVANPDFMNAAVSNIMQCFTNALKHLPAAVDNAADNILRQQLFDYLVSQGDYSEAARALSTTRMEDQGVYAMAPEEKAEVFVKIAECFLADRHFRRPHSR